MSFNVMEHRRDSRLHYRKCSYRNCNVNNRICFDGNGFHSFPVNDSERCITWLVNCGLDDWAEMPNSELKRKYICSRHFSKRSFFRSGRLRKDAIPYLWDVHTGSSSEDEIDFSAIRDQTERQKLEEKLQREKNTSNVLRSQLRAKCEALNKINEKLASGEISDSYLKKAIARRVHGFVFTFISMQLFPSNESSNYTTEERRLCSTMHSTSPSLYSRMRDILKFNLPSPATIISWFD
ncbi:hypothetical protein WN55_05531 [Dufourea novaeangliae]|uniref:THAP-type domain-containing protein n=1 Tax=Dufourea novaeangliae TaxID=178035 RepID=A0A154PPC4_DUFNO|nr:hypothetical protein WN55_05531 [Dufourea novaeangliae]